MLTKIDNPRINWSHPITRGLQMDWILNEKGGKTPRDLVVGSKLTNNNNDWTHQYGDYGLRFDASGEYSRITNLPPRQQFSRLLTVEIEFSRDSGGSGTNYGTLCGLGQGGAFGDRIWLLENDNANAGWGQTLQVWWNSQPGIWSIPYPASGKKHHLVIMYDGGSTSNNPIFILNGVKQTVTRRLDPSGSLRTGGSHFALGNSAEAGGAWDGNVYRTRVWNRMLTDREARALYANPHTIYAKSKLSVRASSTVHEATHSAVALALTVASVVTSYVQVGTATPDPISLSLSAVAPSSSHVAEYTRTPDPIGSTLSVVSPTSGYYQINSTTPDPTSITTSIVTPIVTFSDDDSPTPVVLQLTVGTPSTSYVQVESATHNPVGTTLSIPSQSSTYEQVSSSSPNPLSLSLSVVSPSTTYEYAATSTPDPVGVSLSVVTPSATYEAIYSTTPDPLSITSTIVTPSSSYSSGETANPTPLSLTITVVGPSSTYAEVVTTNPTPVGLEVEVVDPTSSYVLVEEADATIATLATNIPHVTTDYSTEVVETGYRFKPKIPSETRRQRLLTPDYMQILVGENEDLVITLVANTSQWSKPSKTDHTDDWTAKDKDQDGETQNTPKTKVSTEVQRSRILTPNYLQILVGSGQDEVLIITPQSSSWSRAVKNSSSGWVFKDKIDI